MDQSRVLPAIYYSDESYSISGNKLMGRQSAGDAFLRAYMHQFADSEVEALLYSPKDASPFKAKMQALGHQGGVSSIPLQDFKSLKANTVYVPSPGIEDLAWHRVRIGERKLSLCGVFHTTATHRIMDTIANLPIAPVREWDSIICTSRSVKQSVENIFTQQAEYLKWKLGATRFEIPQLPVIPLGVHGDDFSFSDRTKTDARQALGIGQNDIVVLFVGRLSFHAKAHPFPMLEGLQRASQQIKTNIHLIQCGWFANQPIEEAFSQVAEQIAPNVTHHFLDGRIIDEKQTAWAAADIFVSLSDNIQETFGLTPIEALAAGLPCIVSDWDGYKDTVEHGVTGFRIPTTMPVGNTLGEVLAEKYATGEDNYDKYCGYTCQLVAVDIKKFTDALVTLITQPRLRDEFSKAAIKTAHQRFEWKVIIRQYKELWEQLGHIRDTHSGGFGPIPNAAPAQRMDPFVTFAQYPTESLHQSMVLTLDVSLTQSRYEQIVNLGVFTYAKRELPSYAECQAICNEFRNQHKLKLSDIPNTNSRDKTILWLIKIGCISFD